MNLTVSVPYVVVEKSQGAQLPGIGNILEVNTILEEIFHLK